MSQPRIYKSNAERQKAYRDRLRKKWQALQREVRRLNKQLKGGD